MSQTIINKVQSDVAELQRNMAQINVLVERMDTTIEKLTELSSNVSKLLAVHEERLEQYEKINEKLVENAERRRDEIENKIKEVYKEISSLDNKVLTEIKLFRDERMSCTNETNNKIAKIEKNLAILFGASVVLGYILSNPTIFSNIIRVLTGGGS
jgi:DNA repair exonuclease SbcCD ATPase subunit